MSGLRAGVPARAHAAHWSVDGYVVTAPERNDAMLIFKRTEGQVLKTLPKP